MAHATPVSRRLNAERLSVLAWPRAILMQLAHPLVAAGVHDHSTFRNGPMQALGRLHATVGAMRRIAFGDRAEQVATIDVIRAIHRRVHGQLPDTVGRYPAGTPYSAEDPDLLLWVHVTLLDSIPRAYDALVAPLSPAERDAYCAETAEVVEALGARPGDIPRSWSDAQAYLGRMLAGDTLAVGPQAQALATTVLAPSSVLVPFPFSRAYRNITVGLLPPSVRQLYGLSWDDADAVRHRRWLTMVRRVRHLAPDRLALWPDSRSRYGPPQPPAL